MFSARTTSNEKTLSQAKTAVAKIKKKNLNTSSFFKVSLKSNNKALAFSLAVQKERSRQQEKDIVYLQKKVNTLCFELAAKNFREKKLIQALKNLQRNTTDYLNQVLQVFSEDGNDVFEDVILPGGNDNKNPSSKSLTSPVPALTTDLFKKPSAVVSCVQDEPQTASEICREEKRKTSSEQPSKLSKVTETSCPSSSNEEIPAPPVVIVSDHSLPTPSEVASKDAGPKSPLKEKTVILNSSMEMTACDDAEIIAVETKNKATRHSSKPATEKTKTPAGAKQVSDSGRATLSEISNAPVERKKKVKEPKKHQAPSRIPTLNNKKTIDYDSVAEPCDTDPQPVEDYFQDIQNQPPNVDEQCRLQPDIEKMESKVSYRRSRSKSCKKAFLVPTKPFILTTPCSYIDDLMEHYEASKEKETFNVFPFCPDLESQDLGHGVDNGPMVENTGGTHKPRCSVESVASVSEHDRDSSHNTLKRSWGDAHMETEQDLDQSEEVLVSQEAKRSMKERTGRSSRSKTDCDKPLNKSKKGRKGSRDNDKKPSETVAQDPSLDNIPQSVDDSHNRDSFKENIMEDSTSPQRAKGKASRKKTTSPKEVRNPRATFVVGRRETLTDHWDSSLFTDEEDSANKSPACISSERPPWSSVSSTFLVTPRASSYGTGQRETLLTSAEPTPDQGNAGRTRRRKTAVNYKEPTINCKMRRADTEEDKKKKKSKKINVAMPPLAH